MPGVSVECVWRAGATLGESPCWDPHTDTLYWLDIQDTSLFAYTPASSRQMRWELATRTCSIDVVRERWQAPTDATGAHLLGCGDMGVVRLQLTSDEVAVKPVASPTLGEGIRYNDGKLGPDGRYWAGTMDEAEKRDAGQLHAFSPDGAWEVLDRGYRVPNGPAFSPDGTIVYHTDSARQVIFAFDYRSGALEGKRVLRQFGPGEGHPDGMTTDGNGDLWVAMWDGSRIEHLAPEGHSLGAISIPTRRPTSCTFASPEHSELYVTSARIGLGEGDPLAGGLFCVRMD